MGQCKHGWAAEERGAPCPTCARPSNPRPKGNTQAGQWQLLDWLRAEAVEGRAPTLGQAAVALGVRVAVVRRRAEALAQSGWLWPPGRVIAPLRLTAAALRESQEIARMREALRTAPEVAAARLAAWLVRDGLLEQAVAADALARFLVDEAVRR